MIWSTETKTLEQTPSSIQLEFEQFFAKVARLYRYFTNHNK